MDKKNASNEESLKSILTQLQVQDLEYQIPLEWSYIEQIYPKNMDLSKLYVIRDFFSKKGKTPRTIQQFRDQHTKEVEFNCTITLPFKVPSPVPCDVTVEEYKKTVTLSYSVTLCVNRYLHEKSIVEKEKIL